MFHALETLHIIIGLFKDKGISWFNIQVLWWMALDLQGVCIGFIYYLLIIIIYSLATGRLSDLWGNPDPLGSANAVGNKNKYPPEGMMYSRFVCWCGFNSKRAVARLSLSSVCAELNHELFASE